jgi:chromosome segregation ATPase
MDGFNAISLKLKEMYQMITLGGDAELELVDTLDPFSEVTYLTCNKEEVKRPISCLGLCVKMVQQETCAQ